MFFGVRLAYQISFASIVTHPFYCIFQTVLAREHSEKVSKNSPAEELRNKLKMSMPPVVGYE